MALTAGELNQRITLLRRDVATSAAGTGATFEQFVAAGVVWAAVTPLSGTERFAGSQRFAESTHQFRVRFRADVGPTWRVEWRGQRFDVIEVLPGGQQLREWLDVLAVASPAENPAT